MPSHDSVYSSVEAGVNGVNRKSYRWIFLAAVVVIISFVTCIAALVISRNYKVEGSDDSNSWCIRCSNIETLAKRDADSMKLYESLSRPDDKKTMGVKSCCAETKEQRTALVQLLSKRLSNKTSASPSRRTLTMNSFAPHSNSLAFAQKTLCVKKALTPLNVPDTDSCLLNINPSKMDRRYELKQGVELIPSGIKIIYPGFYFVYKSVNFFPDSNEPCKKFKSQTFRSFLIRRKQSRNTILVSSEHTCCPDCFHNSETGFAGGVFQLEKGDVIQVNVTGAGIIHIGRDVTYVGLMMMGGLSG